MRELKAILLESLSLLKEQGEMTPPAPAPGVPPAVPTSPTAPAQPPAPTTNQAPDTVEKLVDQINNIRAGKSFAEPAIYKAVSDFYETLQPQDKTVLHNALDGIVNVLNNAPASGEDTTQTQAQNTPTAQPPVGGQQGAVKAPSGMGAGGGSTVTSGGGGAAL